jgi:Zn-dependent protease with chaperone function
MTRQLLLALLLAAPLPAQPPDQAQPAWDRLRAAARDLKLEIDELDARLPRVQNLGNRLTSTQRRFPLQWHFAVVRSPRPDAGCSGEGAVYVTSALLDLDLDDDELAGILGHEIAHGLLRHVEANQDLESQAEAVRVQQRQAREQVLRLEQDRSQMGEAAYRQTRADLLETAIRLNKRINSLKAQALTAQARLQEQESQADSVGLQMARRAGFRADGLLRALRRLQSLTGQSQDLGGFRHPPLEQRIRSLEEL